MRADDGLRESDACRHRWVSIQRIDKTMLRWMCFVCDQEWKSVGVRAEVSSHFVTMRGKWLP